MINPRESIYLALFTKLSASSAFAFATRKNIPSDQLGTVQKPALEMLVKSEVAEYRGVGIPPKWRMVIHVFVYVDTNDPDKEPATTLNELKDAIEAAVAPDPSTSKLTLGNLAVECRIQGSIEEDLGLLAGVGGLLIPLEIMTTS